MNSEFYRVIYVQGQGYGTMSPSTWFSLPEYARQRVTVLALCDTQAGAVEMFRRLPQDWQQVVFTNERRIEYA